MGFATKDMGMSSVDVTSSPTFIFASTSGTSGCKNWDFAEYWKVTQKKYLVAQWQLLSEEAAAGRGKHLEAMAGLMGCSNQQYDAFAVLVQDNYTPLFNRAAVSNSASFQQFMNDLSGLLARHQKLRSSCHRIDEVSSKGLIKSRG